MQRRSTLCPQSFKLGSFPVPWQEIVKIDFSDLLANIVKAEYRTCRSRDEGRHSIHERSLPSDELRFFAFLFYTCILLGRARFLLAQIVDHGSDNKKTDRN